MMKVNDYELAQLAADGPINKSNENEVKCLLTLVSNSLGVRAQMT